MSLCKLLAKLPPVNIAETTVHAFPHMPSSILDGRFAGSDNGAMDTSTTLDVLFDTLGECLTVDTASKLTNLSLPVSLQVQLDDWADRNSLGQLGEEELSQYEAMLRALNFIAVLQAKARRIVAASEQ